MTAAQTLQLTLNFEEVAGVDVESIHIPTRPVKHKISDFGDKIGGAKKDLAQAYLKSIQAITNDDLATKPLSKVLPRFNLATLVQTHKLSKENALWIRINIDRIGDKPRRPYKLQQWIASTRKQIDEIESCLKNNPDPSQLELFLDEIAKSRLENYLTYQLYQKLADRLNFPEQDFSLKDIELIYNPKAQNFALFRNRRFHSVYDSFDTAVEAVLQMQSEMQRKKISFVVYRTKNQGTTVFFIGKKTTQRNSVIHLVDGFQSAQDAFSYLKDNESELIQIWEKLKYIPDLRSGNNRPRQGEDWRKGSNVSPLLFLRTFGFRGVEFGNWLGNEERQAVLNRTFDALMDLSQIINKSPRALSLNGELALAFGARGGGAAAGHYEPGKVVINLTRTKGDGVLAHEWFHAVDNYFARQAGYPNEFVTKGIVPLRVEMNIALKNLRNYLQSSEIYQRAQNLDAYRSSSYWSSYTEMAARCFESYLLSRMEELNISNDYLVKYSSLQSWLEGGKAQINTYPYPINNEKESINIHYDELFSIIQEKMDMESENVLLFKEQMFYSNAENTVLKIQQTKASAEQWLAAIKKSGGIKKGEDQWMGLTQWLQEQGENRITKGEILEYISSNKIVLNETLLQNDPKEPVQVDWRYFGQEYEWVGTYDEQTFFIDKHYVIYDEQSRKIMSQPKFDSLEEAQRYTAMLISRDVDLTRNAQWTTAKVIQPQVLILSSPMAEPWTFKAEDWHHYTDIDEARAIVWMRFGKVIDSTGRSILLIDEIQSDRHQVGRKNGYRTADTDATIMRLLQNAQSIEEKRVIMNKVGEQLVRPPVAPFEKNWHELAIKRLLAYAVEAGYDRIAWTTGEQQARRYGFWSPMKTVDIVSCTKGSLFPLIVTITQMDNTVYQKYVEAKEQLDKFGFSNSVAHKIEYGQRHFNRSELCPQCHGLSDFYDKILVQYVNGYTKKWGCEVKDVHIQNSDDGPLHGIEITSLMRQALQKAQPLFMTMIPDVDKLKEREKISSVLMSMAGVFHTPVTIVNTKAELPQHILQEFKKHQNKLKECLLLPGVYDEETGQVYFVLQDIPSEIEARQVFFHEVIAHKGIEGVLGKEKAKIFYSRVFDGLDIYTKRHLLQKYGSKQVAAAEYVAMIAEENRNLSVLGRIIEIFKELLRSVGFSIPVNDRDIVKMLTASKQYLQNQQRNNNSLNKRNITPHL